MPTPTVFSFPVKRPGFIETAEWVGTDDDLFLFCGYRDQTGAYQTISFATRNANEPGEICIPSSNDVANLGPRARDILVAHLRMACMIGGVAIPGSAEFTAVLADQANPANLQTAVGDVKITSVALVDDTQVNLTFRQGGGAYREHLINHDEINKYSFIPATQLLIIPGSVKKQFPTYVHNHPNTVLTTSQKADIVSYVLGLAPWI